MSHVGLRRIVLETPELEREIGTTFSRALLARAEQNLYGRLTFEEFVMLAREVAAYEQERNYRAVPNGGQSNNRVAPRGGQQHKQYRKAAPRNQVN